jgi:transcriptional antiterminator RfaH
MVARTEPQREKTAQRFLELAGFSVYLPRIRERYAKGGRRIERLGPLFPSYAFVAFRDGRWWDVRWCVGVAAVIMSGGEPAVVSDAVIAEIRGRERDGLVVLPRRDGFKVGDRVRVVAGPLQGQLGLFDGMRPHERVRVLLALFGGIQRVELARGALEGVD